MSNDHPEPATHRPAHDPIVGIDLGTTFSLVAYVDERGAHIIRDEGGDGRVPSVISMTPSAGGPPAVHVGWDARNHAIENPRATVYSVKRLIGKSFAEIQRELPFLAYGVSGGPRETVRIEINGRLYHPEEISSLILRELKTRAEQHLGRKVRKAVITVPAYFDDAQRQATRDAGRAAGIDVVRIINEPTAAALAYGIGLRGSIGVPPVRSQNATERPSNEATERRRDRTSPIVLPQPRCHEESPEPIQNPKSKIQNQETVAVFDLGGGTFDISVLRIEEGVFQVLATAGDTHLGGDDFDRRIIELVQDDVRSQFGVSIDAPAAKQALRTLAEAVKVRLSEQNTASLELDLGKTTAGQPRVYQRTLTRDEFEGMTTDLVDRTIALLQQALRDAKIDRNELAHIVLVGGSTRMPLVRKRVEETFGRAPYTALNPDEVVALGAAVQAALLAANQTAPGSAARAALPDLLLLDVTPLSLGIETLGGAMSKLILRNTTIPCRAVEQFSTFVDGQTAIKLNVLQGERELARDCRTLGEFELRGIPPMPAGIPRVEVEFLIDANGILNVSARELRSGQAASIQIAPNRGLTRAEAERIAREGIEHGLADIAEHRRIDLLNQIEFDTRKTEQMLARVGSLLAAQERAKIESDIAALRERGQTEKDLDALHRALTDFGHSTLRLAELGISEALRTG